VQITSRQIQQPTRLPVKPEPVIQNDSRDLTSPVSAEPVDSLGLSPLWSDAGTEPVEMPESAPPALQRPVIYLHGFTGSASGFDHITEWLTSGDEPVNKSGGIIDAGNFDNLDPEANLFSLRLSRSYNSVEKNAAELKQTIDAVLEKTGSKEVDLVVHSLGGLNARAYLQNDDERVNKLVQIGTPNHGSALADLERFFRKNFDYPIKPPVDDPEVRRVLEQLSVDKLDGDKQPKNPWLRALNDDWANQRDAADIMIVAGAGIPTLTGGPGLTIFGDGVVTRRSAKMGGVEHKTSWFKTHGGLLKSGKVMEATANFLVGNQLTESEHLFDNPEDMLKAAELLNPQKPPSAQPIEKATAEEAQRATKLPLLEPAFQMGLALGVISSMMGGVKETFPLIELGLNTDSQSANVRANYSVDLDRENGQVQGSGLVDGRAFAEVADFQEGKMYWRSALELQSSGMVMEVGEDEKSITMKGLMGGVPTDLTINMLLNEGGKFSGLETTGQFNGEAYRVRATVDMGNLLQGGTLQNGMMHINGNVNGEDVERNYRVDVTKNDKGLEFNARTAEPLESSEDIDVKVKVIQR
jgi:pimeloyl-ACP methyl ester carboxylesterase